MHGLLMFCIIGMMMTAGLESGAPGIAAEAVKVAAEVWTLPHLPDDLDAAIIEREAEGGHAQ